MGLFSFLLRRERTNDSSTAHETTSLSQTQAERISKDFGKFMAERLPIIADASLLPHPKATIMAALLLHEQHLCDAANWYTTSVKVHVPQQIVQHLQAIRSCRMSLCAYAEVDAEDREVVRYFNAYRSIQAVPDHERNRCMGLVVKYMSRGMDSEMPGWSEEIAEALAGKTKQQQ